MDAAQTERITTDLAARAALPGANRASLTRYLQEAHGMAAADADAIVQAVCKALLDTRFPPISQIELMLTEDCNQRCDYCFVEGKNTLHRMPEAVAFRAVDFLLAHCRNKDELRILFFGGEPLMEFDLIRRIVERADAAAKAAGKRMKYSMTTNGTLLDEPVCRYLAGHRIPVLLSIDGAKQDHDRHRRMAGGGSSYDRIMERLPILKRYQPWLGARMTVMPDTVDRLLDNARLLAGRGINQFLVGPATGMEWPQQAMDTFRDRMIALIRWAAAETEAGRPCRIALLEEGLENFRGRRHLWGCRAGRHSLTVTWDGSLFPCSKMLGVDGLKGIMPLGSLEEGITEIYNRLALCGRVPIERPDCEACDLVDCCMGGCFATNYQATGSPFKSGIEDCRLRRAVVGIVEATRDLLPGVSGKAALVGDAPERAADKADGL